MPDSKKKPIQIYLREDQLRLLRVVAERRGESMAELVRQGVDLLIEGLPVDEDPLLEIIGLYDSDQGDLAEKHDEYLVGFVKDESSSES